MSLSKYSKRRGQFEALEAKQLLAADLTGGTAIDLPDTAVVAENVQANFCMGSIKTSQESGVRCDRPDLPQLGGQQGEDITREPTSIFTKGAPWAEHNIGTPIGGQEGKPVMDPSDFPDLVDHVFQAYAKDDFQFTDQHYFAVR